MTRRTVLALGAFAFGQRSMHAQTIRLSPNAESSLRLEVRKTGLMAGKKHLLVFRQFEGAIVKEPSLRITLAVQVGSLECQDAWLKAKDREKVTRYAIDDLLQASQYQSLRFESTNVQPTRDGYTLAGKLTIRDQTRPVTVNVNARTVEHRTTWTGDSSLRLTDFGLKPPTAALGAVGTEDQMQLSFRILSDSLA